MQSWTRKGKEGHEYKEKRGRKEKRRTEEKERKRIEGKVGRQEGRKREGIGEWRRDRTGGIFMVRKGNKREEKIMEAGREGS